MLGPQLDTGVGTKDRSKDPKQCVPRSSENHLHSVVWEIAPFDPLFAALFILTTLYNEWFFITIWKTDPVLQNLWFSYPKQWQRCPLPSSEKIPVLIVFCSSIGTQLGAKHHPAPALGMMPHFATPASDTFKFKIIEEPPAKPGVNGLICSILNGIRWNSKMTSRCWNWKHELICLPPRSTRYRSDEYLIQLLTNLF